MKIFLKIWLTSYPVIWPNTLQILVKTGYAVPDTKFTMLPFSALFGKNLLHVSPIPQNIRIILYDVFGSEGDTIILFWRCQTHYEHFDYSDLIIHINF